MNKHREIMWKEAIYVLSALGLLYWQPSTTNALLFLIVIMLAENFRNKGN